MKSLEEIVQRNTPKGLMKLGIKPVEVLAAATWPEPRPIYIDNVLVDGMDAAPEDVLKAVRYQVELLHEALPHPIVLDVNYLMDLDADCQRLKKLLALLKNVV